MEALSGLVKVTLPNYLSSLPIPNSFTGWFKLGCKYMIILIQIFFLIAKFDFFCAECRVCECTAIRQRCWFEWSYHVLVTSQLLLTVNIYICEFAVSLRIYLRAQHSIQSTRSCGIRRIYSVIVCWMKSYKYRECLGWFSEEKKNVDTRKMCVLCFCNQIAFHIS